MIESNLESNAVIYEVNLKVEHSIAEEYTNWLIHHIDEILKIDGFLSGIITTPELAEEDKTYKHITCCYKLTSRERLENYFNNYAKAMRDDGVKRFGDKFKAERRILLVTNTFNSSK